MKRILAPIVIPLTLFVVFSSTSFAGWTKLVTTYHGGTSYVDYDRTRKHGGYIYFWTMTDYLEPRFGVFSDVTYHKGHCGEFKYKWLTVNYHKGPMGRGELDRASGEPTEDRKGWVFPPPDSAAEHILKSICNR